MTNSYYNITSWNKRNKEAEKKAAKKSKDYARRSFNEVMDRYGKEEAIEHGAKHGLSLTEIGKLVKQYHKE